MKIKLTLCLTSLILLSFTYQDSINFTEVCDKFQEEDWSTVLEACRTLENQQEKALPYINTMLSNQKKVKIINTSDLIYPSAERFYGHGQIINYDIDYLDIRAGWLYEQLTFQNFGFSIIHDSNEALLDHLKNYFTEDYNHLVKTGLLSGMSPDDLRNELRKLCSRKATEWFAKQTHWERFNSLLEALTCNDPKRQVNALLYLRTGETACSRLNVQNFKKDILPLLKPLSHSNSKRISEQAIFLINDKEYDFLKIKPN